MKLITAYLKKTFFSPIIYFCIIAIAVIVYIGMPKENFMFQGVLSAFDIMLDISSYRKLIMVFAAIPFTAAFCQEYINGSTNLIAARTSPKKYILSHIILCFLIAFITAAIGMTACVMVLCCKYNFFISTDDINTGAITKLYYIGHEYLYFFLKVIHYSLSLSAWSLSGLALSSVFVNPFIAVASPLVFSYILEMITIGSNIFPDLWHLSLSYTDISENALIASLYIIFVFLILSLIFAAIFRFVALRRLRNEIT